MSSSPQKIAVLPPPLSSFPLLRAKKFLCDSCESQNGQRGLEKGLPLGFWALPSTFAKQVFDPSISSRRKGRDREKNDKKWKIMMF